MLAKLNFLSFENRSRNRASLLFFALFIALQLAALYTFVWYFFRPTWNRHVEAGAAVIVSTIVGCNVVFCFGEYLFHRYLLHIETVRFLGSLCSSHRAHHKLTAIRFDDSEHQVRSDYPVTSVERDDQATFPPWSLVPFFAFFTPFFAPMAFSFPEFPILIGGYAAIAIAYFLYETIHVIHHEPYEWWEPKLSGNAGAAWKKLYGFHQAHHANYKCNLNVAGFFGIPLADIVFGTYKQPDVLLVDGAVATKEAARRLTPSPRWPISWLDGVVHKRRRWMVKQG
jgi:hypothetical protein